MSEEKNINNEKRYPETCVGVLIYNDQGEVLFIKSSKWGEYWNLTGGHVELGETAVETAKREVIEETGLEIDNIKFLGTQDCIYPKNFERKVHFIFLDYSAHLAGGKMAEKNREMDEYKWIKPEAALKELKLNPYTKVTVERYIENGKNDYNGLYKRALADYQNLLKQTAKEKMEFAIFANELMLKEILPVYGHLKMAVEHGNGTVDNAKEIAEGVKHVVKQFRDVLEKLGVEEIKTVGEKFDHNKMEAIQNEETEDKNLDGKVARQMKAGYTLNGKVIEAAKVVVYKVK
jgi:molecular chaperone GrpE (heat shock protein)